MRTINMHEAKTHLSRLVDRVAKGETVVIGKAGKPMALLSPYEAAVKPREPGAMKGKIRMARDFDASDAFIAGLFKGEETES